MRSPFGNHAGVGHRSLSGVACALGLMGAAVLLGGCGAGNPHPVGSYERADYFADKGKSLEAAAAYESFVRHNPADSLASEAQFHKAMLYMQIKEYPLAAVEFQILRKDFPTSDRVEEALYQEGLAYLRQVGDVERDITGAVEARAHFTRFRDTYPNSERLPAVNAELTAISDMMVRKRLAQLKVFKQLGRWGAVAAVLDGVLIDEAASTLVSEVLWERGRVAERLDDSERARDVYGRLVADHPDSRFAARAGEALKRLAAAPAPDAATPGS